MPAKAIPVKSQCECNSGAAAHNNTRKMVINVGSCRNEKCSCKTISPEPNNHLNTGRLVLTDDLLTGIVEIDRQHRKLFEMGNNVLFPNTAESDTRLFGDALVFLARYVNFHFLAEEDAMERYGYDRYESHKKQHHRFRVDLKELLKRAKAEGPSKNLKLEFHFMFSDWFMYHIRHTDRAFVKFIKDEEKRKSETRKEYKGFRRFGIAIEDLIGDTRDVSVDFVGN